MQLVEGEWLGDVVDRSCAQSRDLRLGVGACAEHHDGERWLQRHQLAEHGDAVAPGQHHIEQHERRLLSRGARQSAVAIGDRLDGIPLTGEPTRHEAGNASLVLDDQDVHEDQTPSVFTTPRLTLSLHSWRGQVPRWRVADTTVTRLSESVTADVGWAEARGDRNEASPAREPTRMTIRPTVLVLALLASLAFAQAAAAQPITLHVTSARTVTNQPDPVELTGTISLAPNNSGSGTPVTGTGTLFTSELHVGDLIKPYTAPGAVPRWLVVASISSDTSLRLTQPGAGGGRYNGPAVSGVKFAALPAQVTISKGDPVTTFKYLVNQEDTDNNTQPASACQPSGPNDTLSSCLWTSIRHLSGSTNAAPGPYNPTTGFQGLVPDSSPVVTSGDQADFANGGTINLPPGKYMISFVADGHKIDGAHFTTDNSATTKVVNAQAQPYDLPLATLRVQVFNDNASTNGQWDEGDETYDPQLNRAARMPGFTAHLADIMGEVTTDWYGNPLCTTYRPTTAPGRTGYELDAEGHPIILNRGGQCVSNMAGEIVVPNMGPDRYAVTVLAPARTVVTPPGLQPTCRNKDWVKTTTLEGGPDWDTWIQEGATGYDTEFLHSGEPTPWTPAGFVCPRNEPNANPNNVGTVIGRVMKARVYYPSQGGLPYNGTDGAGYAGTKLDGPISRPWVSLASLQGGDVATAVVRGNTDGTFTIPRVPPGDYMVSVWDEPLNEIIDSYNLTVRAHQTTNIGDAMLVGWFAEMSGTVFNDLNENGRQDPGEPGIPGFPVFNKTRNNSIEDQGSQMSLTDMAGHYNLNQAYPLNQFNVIEAYADGWKTTGVTYQADNQPTPTTALGAGVDVSYLPIIGLSGRLDWGVKPYAAGDNGGIVGTVSYGTTRNEVDPSEAVVEDYQPGIPGIQVDLFKPVACDCIDAGRQVLPGRLRARSRRLVRARRLDQPLPDRVVAAPQELHRPHRHRRSARRRAGASAHDRSARQPGRLPRGADDGHPVRRRRSVQLAQPRRELLQLGRRQLRLRRRLDRPRRADWQTARQCRHTLAPAPSP